MANFDQSLLSGLRHLRPAPRTDHPRTGHKSHDFIGIKHQRRQVVACPHHLADPGLPLDGHARADQISHVAVDRPLRDLQTFGQLGRRQQPTAPQILDNLKKAVGATHQ